MNELGAGASPGPVGGPTPSLPRSEVPSSRSSMVDSASEMSESDTDAMSLSGKIINKSCLYKGLGIILHHISQMDVIYFLITYEVTQSDYVHLRLIIICPTLKCDPVHMIF